MNMPVKITIEAYGQTQTLVLGVGRDTHQRPDVPDQVCQDGEMLHRMLDKMLEKSRT